VKTHHQEVCSEGYPRKAWTISVRSRDTGGQTSDPAYLPRFVREWKRGNGSNVRERIIAGRCYTGTKQETPLQAFRALPECLLVIRLTPHDPERPVELLSKDETNQLVGESHPGEGQAVVGSCIYCLMETEWTADQEDNPTFAG
jgi:hypothetical protein